MPFEFSRHGQQQHRVRSGRVQSWRSVRLSPHRRLKDLWQFLATKNRKANTATTPMRTEVVRLTSSRMAFDIDPIGVDLGIIPS